MTTLPNLPPIVYGTAWKKEATARLVEQALRAGFRGVDTACQPKHYDEAGAGDGIAAFVAGESASTGRQGPGGAESDRSSGAREGPIWIQTKFTPLGGHDPARIPYDPDAAPALQVAQSFAVSQRNLRRERVDALVLHSPVRGDATWRAMEELVDAGHVGHLGISNCYELRTLQKLHRTARVKPAIVQNRFYAETGYDREIRAFCRANGIVYQSFWTLTANPALLASAAIRDIAQRRDRTLAQVLFRWLGQNGVVPLTGTRSIEHMREDLAITEFELDAAELASIDALL